jgi:hypothetical protein
MVSVDSETRSPNMTYRVTSVSECRVAGLGAGCPLSSLRFVDI